MHSQVNDDLRSHDVRIPPGETIEGQEPYAPARRHWPGILAALVIALAVVLIAVAGRDDADDLSQATATDASQRIGPTGETGETGETGKTDAAAPAGQAQEPALAGSAPSP